MKCGNCLKVNKIPEYIPEPEPETINQIYLQYTSIVCPFCQNKFKTRKESEYVICGACKSTVVIAKFKEDAGVLPFQPFNPYALPSYDPLYLEKDLNQYLVEERLNDYKNKIKDEIQDKKNKDFIKNYFNAKDKLLNPNFASIKKYNVYKPVFETINEINDNIKRIGQDQMQRRMFFSKNEKKNHNNKHNNHNNIEIANIFKDSNYLNKLTKILPKLY